MARFTTTCLAAACLALAAVAPAQGATVQRGDHGRAVEALQRALHLRADGMFGPATRRALRRFQRAHGLRPDGVAGPATWRKLHAVAAARHAAAVHVTSRGAAVRDLQHRLGIPADGVFGPQTAAAVRRFQAAHGLTRDGVVGPATWAALGAPHGRPVLRRARARRPRHRPRSAAGGGLPAVVRRAIAAGNRIDALPYRYGGGHRTWNDTGYDCSGSVSYVLHGAGLLRTPEDSSQLMRYGAPGPGRWITIYANPGHAYMVVAGRRFDTSTPTGRRWQSAMRSSAGYTVRHPPGL